jgi:hypothetical protein
VRPKAECHCSKLLALPMQVRCESCEIDGLARGSMPFAQGLFRDLDCALRLVLSGPRCGHGS